MKIDVVIPWVDGNDPVLNRKRSKYAGGSELKRSDVGGATRYADLGEIHYCVRSINRFAKFVNKIYIVTDGQDPHVESAIPVGIVDHKVIFRGYGEYLPTFNSNSIETLLHKIPGLSEHYILMNDDFFFVAPTGPEDFFTEDGKVLCYTKLFPSLLEDVLIKLSTMRDGYRRSTFKGMLKNGCDLTGKHHPFFFYLVHSPRPLLKSVFEGFFEEHPEAVTANLKYKFRNPEQFESQALMYMLLWEKGQCKVMNPAKHLVQIRNWKKGAEYASRKLALADSIPTVKFVCFNSLDLAEKPVQRLALDWLEKRLSE